MIGIFKETDMTCDNGDIGFWGWIAMSVIICVIVFLGVIFCQSSLRQDSDAYNLGFQAAKVVPANANPYNNHQHKILWFRGWMDGQNK